MIYLDNAATSYQKPCIVYKTLCNISRTASANAGRGGHDLSIRANELIINAKDSISQLFGIRNPTRLALCQNTTLALNMGILGTLSDNDHVIISSMEHNSVSKVVYSGKSYEVDVIVANKEGYIAPIDVENCIKPNTKLIIINHASNVTGSVQDIEQIGAIARKHKILFMIDAAQSGGVIDINVDKCNIDLLAFAGHKSIMGPLGTAGLYVRENVPIRPIIFGGTGSMSDTMQMPDTLPDMLQAGTINTPAIAALGVAAKFVVQHKNEIAMKEKHLTKRLIHGLLNIKGVRLYGSKSLENRVGAVSFNIAERDCVDVSASLNEKYQIAVRSGFHCAYLAHKTIGTESTGTIRASIGFYTKTSDIDKLLFAVNALK